MCLQQCSCPFGSPTPRRGVRSEVSSSTLRGGLQALTLYKGRTSSHNYKDVRTWEPRWCALASGSTPSRAGQSFRAVQPLTSREVEGTGNHVTFFSAGVKQTILLPCQQAQHTPHHRATLDQAPQNTDDGCPHDGAKHACFSPQKTAISLDTFQSPSLNMSIFKWVTGCQSQEKIVCEYDLSVPHFTLQ